MRVRMGGILAAVAFAAAVNTAPAVANSWAGSDPGSNFPMLYIPQTCWDPPTGDPTGAACLDFSVGVLNQARASLGQPAYILPSDFDALSAEQQLFILTNDDRVLYDLSPVPGLNGTLDQAAAAGVQSDNDPWPSGNSWQAYTSNWAGGYQNAVLAYEGWMYDDGLGSGNLDCTSTNSSGCWGHRHDVLWEFGGGGAVAMGAAAGADAGGMASYAMLLVQGDSSYQPSYSYTWEQAVADGAGGASGGGVGGSGSTTGAGGAGSTTGAGGATSGSNPGSSGATSGSGPGTSGSGEGTAGSQPGSNGTGSSPGTSPGSPSSSSPSTPGSPSTPTSPSAPSSPGGHHPAVSAHGARLTLRVARLRVHGHRIWLHLSSGARVNVSCSLRRWTGRKWQTERSKRCGAWTAFRHVPSGHYRLRITSAAGTVMRRVTVR